MPESPRLRDAIIRWAVYFAALFVIGPLAGTLTGSLRAVDGGTETSPLLSTNPTDGLLRALGALGIALVVGAGAARFIGARAAMTAAGIVVAWAAWRTGTIDQIVRTAQSGSPLYRLALEGAVFAACAMVIVAVITLIGPREHPDPQASRLRALFGGSAALSVLPVTLIVGAAAAWLIAVEPLKGQSIAAAIVAGVAGAAAGRLVDHRVPLPTLVAGVALLAIVGPLSGIATAGQSGVVRAVYAGTLFHTANPLPLDWIAGALLGIPLGVSWASSMIERRADHPEA